LFPLVDKITAILHPNTYLNKLLIGFDSGIIQLWNFKHEKLIYEFPQYQSSIACLIQSPVLDVIAIGTKDGKITLINIRFNELLMKFQQNSQSIRSISFRKDSIPYIASANDNGEITIWNLEKKKLQQIVKAHSSGVVQLHFVLNKPILLTQGKDNKLKQWIFDNRNNCRILKERTGHYKPPTNCLFFDSTWLLTTGPDQMLRLNHAYRDQQNQEFSQGKITCISEKSLRTQESLRLNPIIQFKLLQHRTRRWSNIVSIHIKDSVARCWELDTKALSKIRFKSRNINDFNTSIALSICGNMGFIGRKSGDIELSFNFYRKIVN